MRQLIYTWTLLFIPYDVINDKLINKHTHLNAQTSTHALLNTFTPMQTHTYLHILYTRKHTRMQIDTHARTHASTHACHMVCHHTVSTMVYHAIQHTCLIMQHRSQHRIFLWPARQTNSYTSPLLHFASPTYQGCHELVTAEYRCPHYTINARL